MAWVDDELGSFVSYGDASSSGVGNGRRKQDGDGKQAIS